MPARFKALLRKLGWLDRLFLIVLAAALAGKFFFPASLGKTVLTFAAFVLGVAEVFKWLAFAIRKLIWRLRYRLVVAYLFIAVVPLLLIFVLIGLGAWILTGQVASHLVTTELDRVTAALMEPARGLARTPPEFRAQAARWLAPAYSNRYPGFEIIIRDGSVWRYPETSKVEPPPAGWGDVSGLVRKDGTLYIWAHAVHDSTGVTMLVPMTGKILGRLVPNLGELSFHRGQVGAPERLPDGGAPPTRIPPSEDVFDWEVPYAAPMQVAVWESPGAFQSDALVLVTRYSAVLRTVFGQSEWRPGETAGSIVVGLFIAVLFVFAAVELVALVIGVRLTRSITRAVDSLYQGTQRIRAGDFSHYIEVRGDDQLAELSDSFNQMTRNLESLLEVAKEKEHLQSEIEIAREVQSQLFPKNLPASKTLELAAMCVPARLVSGDYYDYMNLEAPSLAFAIGDVSGKGISAALLMATVQSTMRTQLRAGRELEAAAGGGGQASFPSTATLVSRLNQQLFAFTPPEKFATFYFALYDDTTGWMTYTNAGHMPPILVRAGAAARLDVTGTVVGAFPFTEYGESSVRLEPGDLLVCFTDGITEPENEFGEMFGEDRLTDLVLKHAASGSQEIIAAVMESVRHWTGTPELQDDMTLLLARRI
jgi:sigma-B regulation protein RsbU (phosphoserine phosphatase)